MIHAQSLCALVALFVVGCNGLYEDSQMITHLDSSNIEELVYRSKQVWAVTFYDSVKCGEPCEQVAPYFSDAAKLSKGVVRFGAVDLALGDNLELVAKENNVLAVPAFKVFAKPGFLNKYKRKFWRPSKEFTGQFTARGIRSSVESEMANLVVPVTGRNATDFVNSAKAQGVSAALLFSSKDRVAPLTKALAMMHEGKTLIGHVSPNDKNLKTKYGVKKAPALVVILASGAEDAVAYEGEALKNADINALDAFLNEHAPVAEATTTDEADEQTADTSKSAPVKKDKLQMFNSIKESSLSAIVAFRYGKPAEEGEQRPTTPESWTKHSAKLISTGIMPSTVLCDEVMVDDSIDPKPEECVALQTKHAEDEPRWVYRAYSYIDTIPADPFTDDYVTDVDLASRDVEDFESLSEARDAVVFSMPENVQRLTASHVSTWVGQSIAGGGETLPFILVGKQVEPPAMFTACGALVKGLASLGYISNPSEEDLALLGVPPGTSLPAMFGLVEAPHEEGSDERQMMLVMYQRAQHGKFAFKSMYSFIFSVLKEFKEERLSTWLTRYGHIVGIKMRDSQESQSPDASKRTMPAVDLNYDVEQPADQAMWSKLCGNQKASNVICVVSFFDGNPANQELHKQVELLKQVSETAKRRASAAVQFVPLWVDATCHTEFAESLGVDLAILPSVVSYHPGKNLAQKMVMGFAESNLNAFMEGMKANQGRGFSALKDRPTLGEVDCASLESRVVVEDEDDSDMEDMLAEIRAEEERERKQAAADAKRDAKLAMEEEKKRKAEAEAAAQAARNGGDQPKPKKKRRRRRRKKAPKDEL